MEPSITTLRAKVIKEFNKHWELNDEAHRYDHFWQVELCGNEINDRLGLGMSPKLIMFAAFFHDLFSWTRINHHELAYEFVRTSDHSIFDYLTDAERHQVAIACRHHRASYKGKFTYTLDELINSADRMMPDSNLTEMIERSLKVQLAKGMEGQVASTKTLEHLKEKFGTGGYARYPDMYLKVFGPELAAQQKAVDELDFDAVHGILNRRERGSVLSEKAIERYYVDANHCDCHPETCCCDDFAVYKRAEGDSPKEKVATSNSLHSAKAHAELLNTTGEFSIKATDLISLSS